MPGLITPTYGTGFARYAAESEAPELWRGLVGAWLPSLGPTGLTLRDWSGHHNHGTLNNVGGGAVWVTSEGRYMLDFSGSDDELVVPHSSSIAVAGKLTLSFWLYFANVSGTKVFSMKRTTYNGTYGWEAYLDNTSILIRGSGSTAATFSNALGGYAGKRANIVFVLDGTVAKLYLDGQYVDTKTIVAVQAGTENYLFGRYYNSSGYSWDGKVGAHLIYNRVLSAAEIMQLYTDPYAMFRVAAVPEWYVAAAGGAVMAGIYYRTLLAGSE